MPAGYMRGLDIETKAHCHVYHAVDLFLNFRQADSVDLDKTFRHRQTAKPIRLFQAAD
jgi:hypothetical protein